MTQPMPAAASERPAPPREARVYERHACDLPSNCQPPSARRGEELRWRATIRDVSQGGLSLVLQRRFERGAALAVELPGGGLDTSSTVLVRVKHVRPQAGGGWALGCSFVSDLSEEELATLLQVACRPPARPASEPAKARARSGAPAASGVLCLLTLPGGQVVRAYVRQMHAATWPPPAGKSFTLEVAGSPPVRVKVTGCRFHEKHWVLECASEDEAVAQHLRSRDRTGSAGGGPRVRQPA